MKNETIKLYNIKYFPKQRYPKIFFCITAFKLSTYEIYIELYVKR